MPYGFRGNPRSSRHNRYAASQRTGRQTKYAQRRAGGNKEVAKKLKPPSRLKSTVTGRNKSAIYTLARQVKHLEMSQYGEKQRQTQCAIWGTIDDDAYEPFLRNKAVACCISDFTPTRFFQGGVQGGVPILYTYNHNWVRTQPNSNLGNEYQWNVENDLDLSVDTQGGYLPLFQALRFRISGVNPAIDATTVNQVIKMRFDLVKFKNRYLPTTGTEAHNYRLPTQLGAYAEMCNHPLQQNTGELTRWDERQVTYNPKIHTLLKTKTVTLPTNQYSTAAKCWSKYVSMKVPVSKDFIPVMLSESTPARDLYTQMPQKDIIWLIITCNMGSADWSGNKILVLGERTLIWRDSKGVAT